MKNKYTIVFADIRAKISEGFYIKGQQLPTELELTQFYNVSRITIKRALSELTNLGLIERTAGKGTFVKSLNNVQNTNRIIGFLFINNASETSTIMNGAETILSKNNYYLTMHNTNEDIFREKNVIEKLINDGILGLIVFPVNDDSNYELFMKLSNQNLPVVFIDRSPNTFPNTCVLSNGFDASFKAVDYLIKKNHRKIAFLTHDLKTLEILRNRYNGYKEALKYFDIEFKKEYVAYPDNYDSHNMVSYIAEIERLLTMDDKPTAIVCSNDINAIDVMRVAHRLGINIPEDVSVIGHDDIDAASKLIPPLTTLRQPYKKIGETAANLLLNMIEESDTTKSRIFLSPELIERDSVKAL